MDAAGLVCGPTEMIDSVEDVLCGSGVPITQIVAERFRYDTGRFDVAGNHHDRGLCGCYAGGFVGIHFFRDALTGTRHER